jgi:hypothetical protein
LVPEISVINYVKHNLEILRMSKGQPIITTRWRGHLLYDGK